MGHTRPNRSSAAEWLKQSEALLERITDDLAADEEQLAKTRDMLASSYRLIRRLDRGSPPMAK
jgi:hypothetical protein